MSDAQISPLAELLNYVRASYLYDHPELASMPNTASTAPPPNTTTTSTTTPVCPLQVVYIVTEGLYHTLIDFHMGRSVNKIDTVHSTSDAANTRAQQLLHDGPCPAGFTA
ncbi:hypothetical protein K458DRAFT_381796 [Lentithecium fluviatile CBS 122367]|uniref:Uncharacterized protein n=1 Tax=Lentithecium fluviatile CBS 122367 TaxID=1168545 RepID=A0A6G1JN45_9PLEO|nr:hypothetical protein K458DRAFT_381796 [Lentithecium fluviatile CBS 122367]